MSEMEIVTAEEMGRELAARREKNPALLYIESLESATSKRTMTLALNSMAALLMETDWESYKRANPDTAKALLTTFPWERVRYGDVMRLKGQMAETLSAKTGKPLSYKTINKRLSALRRTMHEAWRLHLIDGETNARIQDVSNLEGETLPAGRDLSPGEIDAIISACANDQTAAGVRDCAIVGVMRCGLRRNAIVRLELADVDLEHMRLTVRNGKRNKTRPVPIIPGADAAIADWLTIRGDAPGPLFYAIRKGGHVQDGDGLSGQALYAMLTKRLDQAGVDDATPHDFRRTLAGDLLDAGVDISTVAAIMGHASVITTQRYDRRPERVKSDAMGRLHFPYRRRTLEQEADAS